MRITKIAAAIALGLPLVGVMGCCGQNPCNSGCEYVAAVSPCDTTVVSGRSWTPSRRTAYPSVAIRPALVENEVEPLYYRLGDDVSANSSAVRLAGGSTVATRRYARRGGSEPAYITPFATRRRGAVQTVAYEPAVAVVPAVVPAVAAVQPVTVGAAVPAIPATAIPVQTAGVNSAICAPGDNLSACYTLPETATSAANLELVVPTADPAMIDSAAAVASAQPQQLDIPDVPVIDAPIASRQELETAASLESPITVSDLAEPTTLPPAIDASQVQTEPLSRPMAEVVTDPEPLAPPAELLDEVNRLADTAAADIAAPATASTESANASATASESAIAATADSDPTPAEQAATVGSGPVEDMPVDLIPPLPDSRISTMAAPGQAASAPQIAEINEVADVIRSRYGDAPDPVHTVELPPSLD